YQRLKLEFETKSSREWAQRASSSAADPAVLDAVLNDFMDYGARQLSLSHGSTCVERQGPRQRGLANVRACGEVSRPRLSNFGGYCPRAVAIIDSGANARFAHGGEPPSPSDNWHVERRQ